MITVSPWRGKVKTGSEPHPASDPFRRRPESEPERDSAPRSIRPRFAGKRRLIAGEAPDLRTSHRAVFGSGSYPAGDGQGGRPCTAYPGRYRRPSAVATFPTCKTQGRAMRVIKNDEIHLGIPPRSAAAAFMAKILPVRDVFPGQRISEWPGREQYGIVS